MLRLSCAIAIGVSVPRSRGRQGAERSKVDVRGRTDGPTRAGCPIEHPRRNLQPSIRYLAGKAAAEHRRVILVDHFMNADVATRPRMPWINKFALDGPMGVPSSSCTTTTDPMAHQQEKPSTGSQIRRAEETPQSHMS